MKNFDPATATLKEIEIRIKEKEEDLRILKKILELRKYLEKEKRQGRA